MQDNNAPHSKMTKSQKQRASKKNKNNKLKQQQIDRRKELIEQIVQSEKAILNVQSLLMPSKDAMHSKKRKHKDNVTSHEQEIEEVMEEPPKIKKEEKEIQNTEKEIQSIQTITTIEIKEIKNEEPKLAETKIPENSKTEKEPQITAVIPTIAPNVPIHTDTVQRQNEIESDNEENIDSQSNQLLAFIPTPIMSIERTDKMQSARKQLPIMMYEREIMDAINYHIVSIISGETGSGKSTQVPQFLYEAGYATNNMIIGITQPRRVAANTLSKRVADELNTKWGKEVGYQVRFDKSHMSERTQIKYMTDGILMREMQSDFMLKKYSIIVIDEAHERNVNTDILISLLSKIIRIRLNKAVEERKVMKDKYEYYPLRLIVMSATLDSNVFNNVFKENVKSVLIPSRQFPVSTHFQRESRFDDLDNLLKVTIKILKTLPKGGLLVFLSSRKDILQFEQMLKQKIENDEKITENVEYEEEESEEEEKQKEDTSNSISINDYEIVPFYSKVSNIYQNVLYRESKKALIVISTNVAETSLTIPNIRYVIDCGIEKKKVFNPKKSISEFNKCIISQASALQRQGRAGRTSAGHCFRTYSTAAFSKFEKQQTPEIQRLPVESTILSLSALGITNFFTFPYLTPPLEDSILSAVRNLYMLGCLIPTESQFDASEMINNCLRTSFLFNRLWKKNYNCSKLGYAINLLNLMPSMGKFVLKCVNEGMPEEAIMLASTQSIDEMFALDSNGKINVPSQHISKLGDHITKYRIINALWRSIKKNKEIKPVKILQGDTHKRFCKGELSNRKVTY